MKKLLFIFTSVVMISLLSCNSNSRIEKLTEEIDSLKQLSDKQSGQLLLWDQMMITMNDVLDSISAGEGMLFKNDGEVPLKKKDVLTNIQRFEEIIAIQKEKIEELEQKLAEYGMDEKTATLIANLKSQIEAKDIEISNLKEELSRKDVDIRNLRVKVSEQNNTITSQAASIDNLNELNKLQEEGLKVQDKMLNQGYVLIASKKELKNKGITSTWSKRPKNITENHSSFKQVDIREWTEVTISGKKVTILNDVPKSSYSLTQVEKGRYLLKINDPASFWKASNYIIIQAD